MSGLRGPAVRRRRSASRSRAVPVFPPARRGEFSRHPSPAPARSWRKRIAGRSRNRLVFHQPGLKLGTDRNKHTEDRKPIAWYWLDGEWDLRDGVKWGGGAKKPFQSHEEAVDRLWAAL